MENIEILWRYQQIDKEVEAAENELRSLPERQNLLKTRNYILEQQNLIGKWEKDAARYMERLEKIDQLKDRINEKITAQVEETSSMQDYELRDLAALKADLTEEMNSIARIDRELMQIAAAMDAQQKQLQKIRVGLAKARKEYPVQKEAYDAKSAPLTKAVTEKRAERDAASKDIPAELLEKYNRIRNTHTPVIVPMVKERCGGCNMQLASVVVRSVKSGGELVECENCGRLLYYKDEE